MMRRSCLVSFALALLFAGCHDDSLSEGAAPTPVAPVPATTGNALPASQADAAHGDQAPAPDAGGTTPTPAANTAPPDGGKPAPNGPQPPAPRAPGAPSTTPRPASGAPNAARPKEDGGGKKDVTVTVIKTPDDFKAAVAKLKGKVVVVNFWATWCGPCVEEFPGLVQTVGKFADKGVVLLTVSGDDAKDTDGKVKPFLVAHNATEHAHLLDTDDAVAFGKGIEWDGAFPTTFVYDRAGKRVETLSDKQSPEKFEAAISAHLN
jgi:thiol-disulfide isomerase/thioredoxin